MLYGKRTNISSFPLTESSDAYNSTLIPFYAPPSEAELKALGKEIDSICVIKKGEEFWQGSFAVAKSDFGPLSTMQGYRYKLKNVHPEEILLDVRVDEDGDIVVKSDNEYEPQAVVGEGVEYEHAACTIVSFVYATKDKTREYPYPLIWSDKNGDSSSWSKRKSGQHMIPRVADKARCIRLPESQ